MSDTPRTCICGRELEAGEKKCPSCRRENDSWWKQAAAIGFTVAAAFGSIAIAVLTGGKVRPKV